MDPSTVAPNILCIGLHPEVLSAIGAHAKESHIAQKEYSTEILEQPQPEVPAIVFCGPCTIADLPIIEVAQSLRMMYASATIYLVTHDRLDFKRDHLKKNGFTDGFLLPNDEPELLKALGRDLSQASEGRHKAFRKIQLIDVTPDDTLGFDLYLHLPANNRRIKYVSASEAIGDGRSAKLRKHNHQVALVTEDQVKSFYQFTARQLKKLGSSNEMSQTELVERREKAVRDLLTGMFASNSQGHLDDGREMMANCQEIIKAYVIDDSQEKNSWYERLAEIAAANAENSTYSRAANTSTFAALLSIALGIGDPKDVALAGLLHDIGLVTIPTEICQKDQSQCTPEELATYQSHPQASIRLIKERRMNVSEKVCSIIEQHHERFDGTGYPKKLIGPRILSEAQVLMIADLLTELTEVKEGFPRVSINEAIQKICDEGFRDPSRSAINPDILRKLKSIFLTPDSK